MKKILFIGMLLSFLSLNSQNYPQKDVQLLLNKDLKVLPKDKSVQKYGYDHFYLTNKLKKKYEPIDKYSDTKHSALVGRVFKVLDIEEYKDFADRKKYLLKIENKDIGILYFKYDENSDYGYPFEAIGGIEFPEGYFCKDLTETKDKFNDKVTVRSPYKETISFTKVTSKGEAKIYMSIDVFGRTINVGKKGVVILLDNKDKMVWENAKISSKVSRTGKGYIYNVFVLLSKEEINILSKRLVTDVKLYIYEKEVSNRGKINKYLNCLIK